MKNLLLVSLCFLITMSCKDDEDVRPTSCNTTTNLGVFHLNEDTKAIIPYSNDTEKIIFTDSLGNEYIGLISFNPYTVSSNNYITQECKSFSDQNPTHTAGTEYRNIRIEIPAADIIISIELKVIVNPEVESFPASTNTDIEYYSYDVFRCTMSATNAPNASFLLYLLDKENSPDNLHTPSMFDSFNLHGVEFNDVYHNQEREDIYTYNMYYNREFGFVGLVRKDGLVSLKYDRVE